MQLPLSGYISARLDIDELPIFQLSKVNYNPSAAVVQMVVRCGAGQTKIWGALESAVNSSYR